MPAVTTLDALLDAVRTRATGIASPIHGEPHWLSVAHVGGGLARATPRADAHVVFLFGLLHDTMRENDGFDPEHGVRAAGLARKLHGDGVLVLGERRLEVLCLACELHADGEVSDDATIGACWDADRLNLWRVGIVPDTALLSTAAAKASPWLEREPELDPRELDWRALAAASG